MQQSLCHSLDLLNSSFHSSVCLWIFSSICCMHDTPASSPLLEAGIHELSSTISVDALNRKSISSELQVKIHGPAEYIFFSFSFQGNGYPKNLDLRNRWSLFSRPAPVILFLSWGLIFFFILSSRLFFFSLLNLFSFIFYVFYLWPLFFFSFSNLNRGMLLHFLLRVVIRRSQPCVCSDEHKLGLAFHVVSLDEGTTSVQVEDSSSWMADF